MECLITQPTHDVYGDKVFKMVTKVSKSYRLYIWIVFHNLSHFSLDVKVSQFLDLIIDTFCNTCHEEFPAVIENISYLTDSS